MALEGQSFQFNMGAVDAAPTKMDISLDDMIKQVSRPPLPSPVSLLPSSLLLCANRKNNRRVKVQKAARWRQCAN
jgi:hypothetical protein